MKTVLVTGSTGLVGSSCVKLFTEKGWDVVGLDNNARARNLGTGERAGALDVDFTRADQIFPLFKTYKFDAVIHAGGQASHDWSNNHVLEDFITNALGTVILLESTRQYCPKAPFIYVSTDKVYGENMKRRVKEGETRYHSDKPFNEKLGLDFAGHRSPFGCSKTAADVYVQEYAKTFGLTTAVFRPGCITGRNHAGAELHGFISYLAKSIKNRIVYKIYGFKGKQVRDQIHADDLANAFWHYLQKPKSTVYNIGGGPERSVSVLEAIKLIEEETGNLCAYQFHEERPGDRIWDVHDVSRFKQDYPEWDYKYSLQDIIKDVCS